MPTHAMISDTTSLKSEDREEQYLQPNTSTVYSSVNAACFGLTGHHQVEQECKIKTTVIQK